MTATDPLYTAAQQAATRAKRRTLTGTAGGAGKGAIDGNTGLGAVAGAGLPGP